MTQKYRPPVSGNRLPDERPGPFLAPYIHSKILTCISGPRESNKSTLCAWIAAHVSVGKNPFGDEPIPPSFSRKVLYYSLEDDAGTTSDRIGAFGGDVAQVKFSSVESIRTDRDGSLLHRDFSNVHPALVVIDSVSAFFGSSLGELRMNTYLELLRAKARRFNCAIVLVHHPQTLPKNRDQWVQGSKRMKDFLRCGFYVCPAPDGRRFFAQAKWAFEPHRTQMWFMDWGTHRIKWGEECDLTLQDVMTLAATVAKNA